ncbi:MAG TPA: PDZ domain-containing protein [Burkholderiaceae bacterium]|nr:PDZ domain-containing protein [Burkholderiaceae bacterium]
MVRYRIAIADLHAHLYQVTLTIPQPDALQRVSLPVWIPGSYLVREFARHLSQVTARQGTRELPVAAIDKATWEVACSGRGALELSYRVYAFDNSVRAAWLDAQRGFFNGTSLCLRVHGREDQPHQVTLGRLPRGWEVATAMPAGDSAQTWKAANYDELIDHPFELGPFWRGRFKAGGVAHEFVVAGAAASFDGERLLADARRICEAQIAFWHGKHKPPFKHYVFMLNAVEEGHGGLEHRASTALVAKRRDLPRLGQDKTAPASEGYVSLLGLISHEYFHTWNVKRLRPGEFASYDLTRENPTRLLWFFEGFTSYYDDLFLVRQRLIDPPQYLRLLAATVNQVGATPGRQVSSVAQASFDAWIKYYRPDENTANATVSYYTKGSLVALALDLTLRSEGRGTLDAVMRLLWTRSSGGPITEDDIAAALQEVGGRSFAPELADWVHGTSELPLQRLLEAVGVRWTHEAATLGLRLGARLNDGGNGLRVQAVMRGSAAEQAGLAAGDEVLALDGWRLRRLDDGALVGALDHELPLLAARDQRLLHLTLPAAKVAGPVVLSQDGTAGAAPLRRRAAWLTADGE